MKIQNIEIKNYRCFKDIQQKFHPQLNVFVGINGSGKTALLEAIKMAVIGAIGEIKGSVPQKTTTAGYAFDAKKDPRINVFERGEWIQSAEISIRANGKMGSLSYSWARKLEKKNIKYSHINDFKEIKTYFHDLSEALQENERIELPVFAYYSTGRLFQEAKDTGTKLEGERIKGYVNASTAKSSQYLFSQWFKRLEQGQYKHEKYNIDFDFSFFEEVKRLICSFVPDCLAILYDDIRYNEIILKFNNGSILPYSMLSDGTRNLVALVSDLALRCAILNPWLGDNIGKTKGVILIDEIELHLHPAWQRMVIPRLLDTFPNIQFFITTHSPQVISTVKKDQLFILSQNEIAPSESFVSGRDSNSILLEIFGVEKRPVKFQNTLNEFYTFLELKEKENAFEKLKELESSWGDTDPDIVRANLYYQDLLDEAYS